MRRSALVGLVVVLATASLAGVVAGQSGGPTSGYGGNPNLDVYAPSPTVSPGEAGPFTIQVANDGAVTEGVPPAREAVTTARNVRVDVDAGGTPLSVASGTRSIGSVTENQPRSLRIDLEVPRDVEPGTYSLEVDLTYSFTDRVYRSLLITSEETRTVTRTVDVVVEDGPLFAVRTVGTDAQVGGSGTATVAVENVGTEPAGDVTVALSSRSQQVTFDAAPEAVAAVGPLAPGETATVEYGLDVRPDATGRSYPIEATVEFEDADGLAGVDEQPSLRVTPLPEPTVIVMNVDASVNVEEEGSLEATVVNEGPAALDNAVVSLEPPSANVEVIEPEVAVGDLAVGESTAVSFDVEVASAARAGPRQFTLATAYEQDGEMRTADRARFRAEVGPERDAFAVDTGNVTVPAGETSRITVRVTNQLDEPVTDVSTKLFASSPLSAADDEAYVASLSPGETVEIPFRVSADGAALTKDYPVSVDVQYVDADGETRLSDSYRRPVTVVEPTGGLFGFLPPVRLLAVGGLVAAALALVPLRRS